MWLKYFIASQVLLVAGLLMIITTYIVPSFNFDGVASKMVGLANIMAAIYLYRWGRLRHSYWRIGFLLLLSVFIISLLMKVQHWPLANTLLAVTMLGVPLYYGIWYLMKQAKDVFDHLKLVAVSFHFIATWLVITQAVPVFSDFGPTRDIVQFTSIALVQTTYISFFLSQRRLQSQANEVWDIDSPQEQPL